MQGHSCSENKGEIMYVGEIYASSWNTHPPPPFVWNNNVLKVMEIPWLEQPMAPTSKLCKGNGQLKNLEPLQDYIKRGCGMNHHWEHVANFKDTRNNFCAKKDWRLIEVPIVHFHALIVY
jgi:hypothetical protein